MFGRAYNSFRNIDLAQLYLSNSSVFDFVIAMVLFTAISRVVFMKKFEGRSGKAVTIAVGTILSFGLVIAEHMGNFNLASIFSPLAILITLTLVGFAFFTLLRAMHAPALPAGAGVYMLTYLCFLSLAESYMRFIRNKIPELEVILFLTFVASTVVLCVGTYRFIRKHIPVSMKRYEHTRIDKIERQKSKHAKKEFKTEMKTEKSVRKDERKGLKDTNKIIRELTELSNAVTHPGKKKQVEGIMTKLRYNDEQLQTYLDQIKAKHEKIRSFDIQAYRELAHRHKGTKLEEQKELFRVELNAERKKLKIDDKIETIEKKIYQTLANFDDHMRLSVYHYNAGDSEISKTTILKARDIMKQIQKHLKDLKHLDGLIDKLCRFQIRKERKQEKTVIQKAA